MGDLVFFLKCIVMTFVFVLLLQIRIGERTVEERTLGWARTSAVVQPLQSVADGAVAALRDGWKGFSNFMSSKFNKAFRAENWPGGRSLGLQWERSQAAIQEQAQKAKSKVKKGIERIKAEAEEGGGEEE